MNNGHGITQLLAENRATADPLPGPLATAFAEEDIQVLGFSIRPVVAYDWAMFKKLKSPVYEQLLETMQFVKNPALAPDAPENQPPNIPVEPEDLWDMIWLLSRHYLESHRVFRKAGKEGVREASISVIGALNLGMIARLAEACYEQLRRSMATMVQYGAEDEKDQSFFREAGAPVTASDGGLIMSGC